MSSGATTIEPTAAFSTRHRPTTALDTRGSAPLPPSQARAAQQQSPGRPTHGGNAVGPDGSQAARLSGLDAVVMVGEPSAASDTALARVFTEILKRKHPRTLWDVDWVKPRVPLEAPAAEIDWRSARCEGDQRERLAA